MSAKPDLKQYQENARDQIKSALLTLLAKEGQDRLVVFKSPTGSGKTITMAYALSALHAHPYRKEFVVLWLSPGKGKLHEQSARALEFFLTGTSMSVHVLSSRADIEANPTPASGSVLVVNWEKLNRQDGGEFTNVMLRDGETTNFFLMLKNLADSGTDVIAVIDESHLNMDAEKTKRLLSEMRAQVPFITIEMSATPTSTTSAEFRSDGLHHDVVVRFADVEAEGMVRRTALLNEDFVSVQKKYPKGKVTLDLQVLNGAWDRIESLRSGYRKEGSKVEPLLLIQYPDGKAADKRASVVEAFLAKKGLVKGKTYAMYLSEDHSEGVEEVAKFDSPFRALIFKQAIATGWDCPRAQVLVQFRDPTSKIFEIQTIGRIMRSPEQHHYANEELNVAYVYSDLPGATVSVVADDPDFKVADTTLARGKAYPAVGLKLHSVFQPRKRELHYPDSKSLEPLLKSEFDSLLLGLLPATPLDSTSVSFLVDAKVDAKDLLTSNIGDFGTSRAGGRMLEGVLGLELAQAIFDRVLTLDIGGYLSREQSRSRIKNILVNWVKSHRPDWNVVHLQHFVLQNQDVVSQAIAAGCLKCAASEDAKAVSAARAKKRDKWDWEIPVSELVSSELYEPSLAGNVLVPALIEKGRSNPERRFEEWLAAAFEAKRIVWWWKNGERDEKYLAVEYSLGGQTERTYPDFLVMSANGSLWVLEVKDIDDPKGAIGGETARKAVGLAAWAVDHNKRRVEEKELFAAPEVSTGIVVPYKEGGAMIAKVGDHTSWQPPTKQNLATNTGWELLGI